MEKLERLMLLSAVGNALLDYHYFRGANEKLQEIGKFLITDENRNAVQEAGDPPAPEVFMRLASKLLNGEIQ